MGTEIPKLDKSPVTVPPVEEWTAEQHAAALEDVRDDKDELYPTGETSTVDTAVTSQKVDHKPSGERPGIDALAGIGTEVADDHDKEVGKEHIDDAFDALGKLSVGAKIRRQVRNNPDPTAKEIPPVPRKAK